MKKSIMIIATALMISGVTFAGPDGDATVYSIDLKNSTISWTGKKIGGEHKGNLGITQGSISVEGKSISSTSIKMDMQSINCTDISDSEKNAKLVGHLKSEDFFSVETYPHASFEATNFVAVEGAKKGDSNYTINGNLSIKGITHEISFPAIVEINKNIMSVKGTMTFDRSKWNIQYGSESFFEGLGDHLIYDDVDITFDLVANTDN